MAKAAGASAVIVYNNADRGAQRHARRAPTRTMPITGVAGERAGAGHEMAAVAVTMKVDLGKLVENRGTFNVLAETQRGGSDNVVMLGSPPRQRPRRGPASTTTARARPHPRAGAEGSRTRLQDQEQASASPGGAPRRSACSARALRRPASRAGGRGGKIATSSTSTCSARRTTRSASTTRTTRRLNPAGVPIPAGSSQTEDVLTDWFDAGSHPWADTAYSGRSDYQAFIDTASPPRGVHRG